MLYDLTNIAAFYDHEYRDNSNFKYASPFETSELYVIQSDNIKEQLAISEEADGVYFSWLLDLFVFHLEYSVYAKLNRQDESGQKYHLALANEYGFAALEYGSRACTCVPGRAPFIIMNKAACMLAMLYLRNDTERGLSVGSHLIASLNGEGCIIKRGYKKATTSWFIVQLFSIVTKQEITLHRLLQPTLTPPFDEALAQWDTSDINTVDSLVTQLCDNHLETAYQNHQQMMHEDEEGEDTLTYKELFSSALFFIPFEVLFWLKLREQRGIANPTEYTHELMHTALATTLLNDIASPIPDADVNTPLIQDILTTLQAQCPELDLA